MTAVRASSRSLPSLCRSAGDAPFAWAARSASSADRARASRSSNCSARATSAACLAVASWLTGLRLTITALSLVHAPEGPGRPPACRPSGQQPGEAPGGPPPVPGLTGEVPDRALPGEVVPAEPPPAEQDEHPAEPGPHQVTEPLAEGRDPAARPPREELEHEKCHDHDDESGDGEDAGRHDAHRRTSAQ